MKLLMNPTRGAAIPTLLVIAVFAAIVGSICIGAYPLSFWQSGRILAHLAWPLPLPAHPAWTMREHERDLLLERQLRERFGKRGPHHELLRPNLPSI